MIEIEGKPFLEHQLNLLTENGFKDIVLCVGHKSQAIKNYLKDGKKFGVRIKYSDEGDRLLGTCGALKKAKPLLNDVFLIMYGDSYLPFNFRRPVDFFEKFDKFGLMVVYRNRDRYERSNVALEGLLVKEYGKDKKTEEMQYIDYGVSIFRKKALELIPSDRVCDLPLLHRALIEKNQLLAYEAKQRFYQIGSPEGLEEFRKYAKRHGL